MPCFNRLSLHHDMCVLYMCVLYMYVMLSRDRVTIQIRRLHRSFRYGCIVVIPAIFACLYLAYSALSNTEKEFLIHDYMIGWPDWAQLLCAFYLRWYFKFTLHTTHAQQPRAQPTT